MVFQRAQQLGAHLIPHKGLQRPRQQRLRSAGVTPQAQFQPAQRGQRLGFAAPVAGVVAQLQRALQVQTGPGRVALRQGDLAQQQLAVAFGFGVAKRARQRQAFLQQFQRQVGIAQHQVDAPQMLQPDGLAQAVTELAKQRQGLLFGRQRGGGLAGGQPRQCQRRQRVGDARRVA